MYTTDCSLFVRYIFAQLDKIFCKHVMKRIQAIFQNKFNEHLSGLLELPDNEIYCFAIFAHCLTCSKDGKAATHISKTLVENGIAVLRFDFTGLENSSGDFSNSNFSSNLDDIFAAAAFLEKNYAAPELLVGHSLGGAAVLAAAWQISAVKAIATINSPSTLEHINHLFVNALDVPKQNDKVEVMLGGLKFTIKKQFVDDLMSHNTVNHIKKLNKALIIFHSPMYMDSSGLARHSIFRYKTRTYIRFLNGEAIS